MFILRKIKVSLLDFQESILIKFSKYNEIKKFKDKRRIKIADSYFLTEEQKKEVDQLYLLNYGKKINYIWHKNYAAHASKFDYRYFPELLYISYFERFMNSNRAITKLLSDKNFLPIVAKAVGVRMPRVIVSCTNGVLRDGDNSIISDEKATDLVREGDLFIKPTRGTCSGVGCLKLDGIDNKIFIGGEIELDSGKNKLKYNRDYVIQNVIKCHDSLSCIYPFSVNTFRVISYLWKNKIEIMPIMLRIGQGGGYLDNAHAGGMFIAVNNDGFLGEFAMTEFNERFYTHPDTGFVFNNHKIEHFEKIIGAAKKIHESIPQIGIVNWDFTLNEFGEPILIEANCLGGGIWSIQMAHGCGPFGDKIVEVLQWIKFMKELKPHERINYIGGKIK